MRSLNRPMFRTGGPIKEGVMHGIREPKNMGGRMLLVGQHPKQFRDAGGREQHFAPVVAAGGLLSAAGRFLPAAVRGFRAARTYKPLSQKLGAMGRFKDIFMPRGGLSAPMAPRGAGVGFRTGSFLRQNPITALSIAPQAGVASYKGGKYLTTEAAPAVGKAYVDALVPGESIFKEKITEEKIDPSKVKKFSGAPGEAGKGGSYNSAKATELAKAAKEKRINSLLETMGYDKAQKNAAYDALIDASKIITDRGSLKGDVTGEIINPIIQATSKRFDKPEQIREAVGLMQAKGDIEKDIATSKGSPTLQTAKDMVNTGAAKNIQDAMKKLTKQSTMADTLGAIKSKGISIGADEVEIAYRIENPDVIPNLKIKGSDKEYKKWKNDNEGKTEMDFMEEIVSKSDKFSPGVYIIDKRAIVVDNEGNMAYEW